MSIQKFSNGEVRLGNGQFAQWIKFGARRVFQVTTATRRASKNGKIAKIGGARNVLRYGEYTHAKLANFVCTKLKDEQETFIRF